MPFLLGQNVINFRDRPLLFIDFEMSGLDVKKHEIIEVAALVVDQKTLAITNSYYAKIIPEHIATADPESLGVTAYSSKAWSDAIPLRQMLTELKVLAPNCILAGWVVQNEWDFLLAALEKEKIPIFFSYYLLEVWTLAFFKFRKDLSVNNLNIGSVCKVFNISLDQHKPDSDIKATYEIFKKLV